MISTIQKQDLSSLKLDIATSLRQMLRQRTAWETIATFNFPLKAGFLVSDRNRADLDWKNGSFSWRYRNKLTFERTFSLHSYHLIPYVAAEPFYDSQYNKWSTTELYAGCLFPVGKHVEFNVYYEHENDTGKSPNTQQNYVGLALYLYFSFAKQ